MEQELTPKQRLFVAEYLKDFNATKAAIAAGYSKKSAGVIGRENITKPEIRKALAAARNSFKNKEGKALMGAEDVERELDKLITFNLKEFIDRKTGEPKPIHELSDDQAACVRELGVLETAIGTHRTLKFYDKVAAIQLKMKRLGMLKEKIEVTGSFEGWLKAIKEKAQEKG